MVQEAVVGVNHISNFFGTILNGLESFKSYFFVSQMKLFLKSIFIVVICKAMCELIESIRWFYCHSSGYYCLFKQRPSYWNYKNVYGRPFLWHDCNLFLLFQSDWVFEYIFSVDWLLFVWNVWMTWAYGFVWAEMECLFI